MQQPRCQLVPFHACLPRYLYQHLARFHIPSRKEGFNDRSVCVDFVCSSGLQFQYFVLRFGSLKNWFRFAFFYCLSAQPFTNARQNKEVIISII